MKNLFSVASAALRGISTSIKASAMAIEEATPFVAKHIADTRQEVVDAISSSGIKEEAKKIVTASEARQKAMENLASELKGAVTGKAKLEAVS